MIRNEHLTRNIALFYFFGILAILPSKYFFSTFLTQKIYCEALTKFDADIEKAREEANVEDDEDRHSTAFAQITEVDKTKDDAHPANLAGTGSQDDNQSVIERIPINASELPPAPTRAQIYGHMFALMEDAEEAEDKLKQIEDEGRKKQNQLLKEKLANRRRRKLE